MNSSSSFGTFFISALLELDFKCLLNASSFVNQVGLPRTGFLRVLQYSPPNITIKSQEAALFAVPAAFPTVAGRGEGVTSVAFAVTDTAGVLTFAAAASGKHAATGEASS